LERFAFARSTCLLATNSAIVRDLAGSHVPSKPSFVTGNPVPRERIEFGLQCSKEAARARVNIEAEQTVIAYTGKLYLGMKELDYLLAAAGRLPDCLFLFTGGQPQVIDELNRQLKEQDISNVRLAGLLKEPEETRYYQQAADVLVTYYSTMGHPFARHNLPGKVPEYMTTGNPIVSADFPAVRDLLNPENSILVPPEDIDALVSAVERAVREREWSGALGRQAQRDVATRTTESLGEELGTFLGSLGN
jgi:glycosyltransferase involved in cell wall biosynthesis